MDSLTQQEGKLILTKFGLVLVLLLLLAVGCGVRIDTSNLPDLPGDCSGTILLFGPSAQALDVSNGLLRDIAIGGTTKFHPQILCKEPGGCLFVTGNVAYDSANERRNMFDNDFSGGPVYRYCPYDSTFALVKAVSSFDYNCESMDYRPGSNELLFTSEYGGSWGVFLLDISFGLLEDYSPICTFLESRRPHTRAWFLDEEQIIVVYYSEIYIVNVKDSTWEYLIAGNVAGQSKDRKSIVVNEPDSGVLVIDLDSLTSVKIPSAGQPGPACFSPDGKFIAFLTWQGEWFLHDVGRLYVYDIENHKVYLTNVSESASIIPSSLIWLDTSLTEPDSLS